MSPEKQTEWQITVEKRLADLETAVFGAEKAESDFKKPVMTEKDRAQHVSESVIRFIETYWQRYRKPVMLRMLSARFAKSVAAAGGYLPTWLDEMAESKRLNIVETGSRRLVFPPGALEQATAGERQSWGILTAEEQEAIEVAKVEAELRAMLRAEHKDG